MTHRVNDVVNAQLVCSRGVFLGIGRIVSPFPGIAEVGIEIDHDHEAAVLILDSAVMGNVSIALVSTTRVEELNPGNLDELMQIEKAVEDGVGQRYLFDLAVGENF